MAILAGIKPGDLASNRVFKSIGGIEIWRWAQPNRLAWPAKC